MIQQVRRSARLGLSACLVATQARTAPRVFPICREVVASGRGDDGDAEGEAAVPEKAPAPPPRPSAPVAAQRPPHSPQGPVLEGAAGTERAVVVETV
jgi:hypothetical protein